MEMKRWLNTDEAFRSESELFRSDRIFSLWAHTVSHRQLLLRTAKGRDQRGRDQATRLDVLFKPVTAVKIRSLLDGLTIHRAPPEEEARIRHDSGSIDFSPDERFLVLESGTGRDYVVSLAFGWCEDDGDAHDASRLSGVVEPDAPPWVRQPLFGANGGLVPNATTLEQLTDALTASQSGCPRETYRSVYVLMFQLSGVRGAAGKATPAGVFLTPLEADQELRRRQQDRGDAEWWIETVPIAV